ncbi:MAG: hypothetical protein KBB37_10430 [Bacteroidia bacterium]|nr:hypothetical protein [Bacteroidia bacterium]MBP7261692.1 hypothetical protein [Bacteroidia bacterium]MBP9179580.1 hypothetical protein [Bacteroidia bacterium]MBP9725273.1 hypothetical protein [Bacteroidia bacterium]
MIKKFIGYMLFWKKTEPVTNSNLRMMHGINRISILLFLFAIGVIVVRLLTN